MSKALLYDATLCIDCKRCEEGCAQQNGLPYTDAVAAEEKQSEHKFTVVMTKGDKFMRRRCMNCQDPACASACPVAALRKTPAGPVIYEADRCMGCRYCMMACPFSVPRYEWGKLLPKVRKNAPSRTCNRLSSGGRFCVCFRLHRNPDDAPR